MADSRALAESSQSRLFCYYPLRSPNLLFARVNCGKLRGGPSIHLVCVCVCMCVMTDPLSKTRLNSETVATGAALAFFVGICSWLLCRHQFSGSSGSGRTTGFRIIFQHVHVQRRPLAQFLLGCSHSSSLLESGAVGVLVACVLHVSI